jgi:pyruvate decarboxylase
MFVGVYNGIVSYPGVATAIEASDFVINTGPFKSDSNTGGFTRNIKPENVVEIYADYTVFRGEKYENIPMKSRTSPLSALTNHIQC